MHKMLCRKDIWSNRSKEEGMRPSTILELIRTYGGSIMGYFMEMGTPELSLK